jgi:hypothetical protein
VDFANQIEAVKADIAKLRGQIEVLTYELEATQKRQKDFYVDLDNRVRKLETAPPPDAKPETPKLDAAQETRDYEAALASLKALKYKEAGAAFLAFIKAYPNGTLAASAHYWGGYAHAQARDHANAADLFGKFAAGWPTDERAAGALESRIASLEALKDAKGGPGDAGVAGRQVPGHRRRQARQAAAEAQIGPGGSRRRAARQRNLPFPAGRDQPRRAADGLRPPHRLSLALHLVRYHLCLQRRRIDERKTRSCAASPPSDAAPSASRAANPWRKRPASTCWRPCARRDTRFHWKPAARSTSAASIRAFRASSTSRRRDPASRRRTAGRTSTC